jgi:hypothetical protein
LGALQRGLEERLVLPIATLSPVKGMGVKIDHAGHQGEGWVVDDATGIGCAYIAAGADRLKPISPHENLDAIAGSAQIVNAIGLETMNVIGAIIFVLATIVFVIELAGFRPHLSPPFVRRHATQWDGMALIKVAIVAAFFGGGLAIFAGVVFVRGIAHLRPAQAFTTVFGILFGLPGALGSAVGNFIGGILVRAGATSRFGHPARKMRSDGQVDSNLLRPTECPRV